MIVEIPLTNFVGTGGKELIERLYALPDDTVTEKKNDYEIIQNLPTIEGYKATRDHVPSVIWNKELEPIFGSDNVCILDPYYILYLQLVKHITEKFDCDGAFKYCYESKDDADVIGCCELNAKGDIVDFLTHIIQTVPTTLYDIADNIGLNKIK
jgi:hypothetical protein